ncbi:unnamed protein product [Arctogadus glacialis]
MSWRKRNFSLLKCFLQDLQWSEVNQGERVNCSVTRVDSLVLIVFDSQPKDSGVRLQFPTCIPEEGALDPCPTCSFTMCNNNLLPR